MPEEPIHQAAERGDVAALRRELDDGVSPNALSGRGRTPLHYLCSRGDNPEARVDCLHVLLEAGANVNAPNVHQNTPLHLAAVRGYANVVAALLEAGADVNRGEHSNFTPLHWACMRYDLHVEPALILLIRNGAAVNARTSQGRTPLDYAIIYRQRLVPILLRAGAALPAHHDQRVHPESDRGGRLRPLRAQPPRRPRRNVRPAFLPPPAGDSPPRRRVRLPRGLLLSKQAASHYQVAPLRALLERGERVGDLGRRDAPAERGEDHVPPARRARVGPAAGGGARQRAALAAAPIHKAVVLARRGRVAARRAEAQRRAVPLKNDSGVLATATHVRRQVVGRVAERLEPAWT